MTQGQTDRYQNPFAVHNDTVALLVEDTTSEPSWIDTVKDESAHRKPSWSQPCCVMRRMMIDSSTIKIAD